MMRFLYAVFAVGDAIQGVWALKEGSYLFAFGHIFGSLLWGAGFCFLQSIWKRNRRGF